MRDPTMAIQETKSRAWGRRSLLIVALGVLTLAAVLAVVVLSAPSSGLDRATQLARDPKRFETGREAGETLVEISGLLADAASPCTDRAPRCAVLLEAAAFAQVLAARALRCTAPGRAEARRKITAVLDDVRAGRLLTLPELPLC